MLKIFITRSSKNNFDKITVLHDQDVVEFVGKGSIKLAANKKEVTDEEMELFVPINDYLGMVLTPDQEVQLFGYFQQAADIIENGEFISYEKEINKIHPLIVGILELIKPANLVNFFEHSSKFMQIPKDLKRVPGGGYYPTETTFLASDYVELVKTTLLIRVLHPIFFGLLFRLEALTGPNHAILICGSLLMKNLYITETAGWKRLKGYVAHSFAKNSQLASSIDVDSTEYTTLIVLCRIVFNRLCCAMIPETLVGKSIINAISSEVKQYENNNNGYRKKESFGDGEDNTSFIDEYQLSEDVPMVKITQMAEWFSFGLMDDQDRPRYKDRFTHQAFALGMQSTKLIDAIYDRLPTSWNYQLTNPARTILQMAFAYDVSEQIYDYCDYLQLTAAIAIAQARLAERGYVYLPTLCCLQKRGGQQTSGNSYLQLTNEDRDALVALCDVQSKNNEGGSFNEAVLYVKNFLEELESYQWQSNLEFGVLENPELYMNVKKGEMFDIEIDPEIKNEFFRLIKEINQ